MGDFVRRFLIDNALMWVRDYGFDGLRFDAVHALKDQSRRHFLIELAETVRAQTIGKQVHLLLENEANQARYLERRGGRVKLYSENRQGRLKRQNNAARQGWRAAPPSSTKEETMRTTTAQPNNVLDINYLLHPGTTFDHPKDVVGHPDLSVAEKRAILASWASDAAAIASSPALRAPEGLKQPVTIDEILEALQALDGGPRHPPGGKPQRLRSTIRMAA